MQRCVNFGIKLRNSRSSGEILNMTTGQGTGGNVIAALCSFFFPGLGQLIQGRVLAAVLFFVGAGVLWFISIGTLGWIVHIWACVNAALWKPKG